MHTCTIYPMVAATKAFDKGKTTWQHDYGTPSLFPFIPGMPESHGLAYLIVVSKGEEHERYI